MAREPGETYKAEARRISEGWFEKYCPDHLSGIDIGCQRDPVVETFRRWDVIFGDGDATYMEDVSDNKFHTVYASHILEHIPDHKTALENWFRITRPGGHLIVLVPHRDLYEKKQQPPSNWNLEHKWFFLPESEEPPGTLNFRKVIGDAIPLDLRGCAELVSYKVLDHGWVSLPPNQHSAGEYSIEAIIKKK